jgi:mxaJ protein
MSFHCRIELYLLCLFMVVPFSPAHAVVPFRICAEPDNLPMSQQVSESGYEIETARLLAKDMGRPLEIKWVAQRDHSYYRQTIGAGACEAIMGVPANFGKLTTTKPLYRTRFFFVSREKKNLPRSFDDEGLKNMRIGVPATGLGDTPPALALTQRSLGKNLRTYSIYEPQKMIDAVADGDLDLAIAWGPFAGWFGNKNGLKISPAPEHDGPLPLAFDISVGVRKGDLTLKSRIETAFIHQEAAIQKILENWHVPVMERVK